MPFTARDVAFPHYRTSIVRTHAGSGDLNSNDNCSNCSFSSLIAHDIDGDGRKEVALLGQYSLQYIFKNGSQIPIDKNQSSLAGGGGDASMSALQVSERGLPLTTAQFVVSMGATYLVEIYQCGVLDIVRFGTLSKTGTTEAAPVQEAMSEFVQRSVKRVNDIPFNVSSSKLYSTSGDSVILAMSALNTIYFCEISLSAGTCIVLAELTSNSTEINSFDIINNKNNRDSSNNSYNNSNSSSSSNNANKNNSDGNSEPGNYIIYSDMDGVIYSFSIKESSDETELRFGFDSSITSMLFASIQSPSIVKFLPTISCGTNYDAICVVASSEGTTFVVGILSDNSMELVNSFELHDALITIDSLAISSPSKSLNPTDANRTVEQPEWLVVFASCSGVTFICPLKHLLNSIDSPTAASSSTQAVQSSTIYRYDARLIHKVESCVLFCCGENEFYYVTSLGQVSAILDVSTHLKSLAI